MKNISTDRRDRIRFYQKIDWLFYMRASCIYMIALLGTASVFAARPTSGQGLEQEVTIGMEHESLRTLFEKIEVVTELNCIFKGESVDLFSDITFPSKLRTIRETLVLGLIGSDVGFYLNGVSIVFFSTPEKGSLLRQDEHSHGLTNSYNQTSVASGFVKNILGEPLPGVNVIVKGTTIGTSTDTKGKFVLEIPSGGDMLVFSFIGLKTIERPLNGQTFFEVEMEADVATLDEVVIDGGYYTTSDRLKTGSIARITSKEIEKQPVISPLMALQGRVPGLDISPTTGVPGSAINVQIRGRNSLRNNTRNEVANSPLFVIDGIPFDASPLRSGSETSSTVYNGYDPLSSINATDIESIEVLKDADATSIFGSRGANGVILIKTKRGGYANKTGFDINVYTGVGQMSSKIDMLNTEQYLMMRREAFVNDGSIVTSNDFDVNGTWDTTRYTDWQKELLGKTARINDMQLGVSCGGGNVSFRANLGYHKETTIYSPDFGFDRYSGSFSFSHHSNDGKFRVNLTANYSVNHSKTFEGAISRQALTLAPNAPRLFNADGTLNWQIVTVGNALRSTFDNPIAKLRNTNSMRSNTFYSNLNLEYTLFPKITAKLNSGYTNLVANELIKLPISAFAPTTINANSSGSARFGLNQRGTWIIEPQLVYEEAFTDHSLSMVLGGTWQQSLAESQMIVAAGYSSDLLINSLEAAKDILVVSDVNNQFRYGSVFFRGTYDYRKKYLLSLTGRRDGSSRFGPGERFGNFGSLGSAWVFSEESAFDAIRGKIFNHGKIRSSYGTTGNDQIGDYMFINSYRISEYQYQGMLNMIPSAPFNPNFGWEITRKFEVAVELGLFKDRLFLEIGRYINRSSNQLVDYFLPSTTGFDAVLSNFSAVVENKGIEALVRFSCFRNENVDWTVSMNISRNRNVLIDFPGIENSTYSDLYKVGEPLSVRSLYILSDVDPETGRYRFVDLDDDGYYTNTDVVLAEPTARSYYGGLTNSLRIAGFDLSFTFQFSRQRSDSYTVTSPSGFRNQNVPVSALSRWRQEGDVTSFPRFTQNSSMTIDYLRYRSSTGAFSDASFVRLRTFSLSWTVPAVWINRLALSQARLFFQGQNLVTFTDYIGWDPETGVGVPPLRMCTIGLSLKM
jgi:TonB-dependent starch-binding outer membrane protein SusC